MTDNKFFQGTRFMGLVCTKVLYNARYTSTIRPPPPYGSYELCHYDDDIAGGADMGTECEQYTQKIC